MSNILSEQIRIVINPLICNRQVCNYWSERLNQGLLTRDENERSHFCIYFLPYNPATRQVFIAHHKKSGLWISPGGHIDKGEILMQALSREIEEELGVRGKIKEEVKPFLLTITPINREGHFCKEHFDIWYLIPTDGSEFNIDPREFHETRWMTVAEARRLVTDPPNIEALDKIEELF